MPGRNFDIAAARQIKRVTNGLAICLLFVSPFLAGDALGEIPDLDRVRVLPSPRHIEDAELTNQDSDPVRLSELHGRVTFVLFGFTNCPDVCPLAMQRFLELHESKELDVAYVLISVDGERDTPSQMKAFLEKYSADFIGLTGEPEAVRQIAKDFSAPFFKGHEDHGGDYEVTHSPQIFLLDRQGLLRAELYNPPLDSMIGAADALIKEESQAAGQPIEAPGITRSAVQIWAASDIRENELSSGFFTDWSTEGQCH